MSTAELIGLLRPIRARVKPAVVSARESAAATTAETLRWLGLHDPAADLEVQAAQEASAASVGVARDLHAVRVLALVLDHHAPLPDPARLRELNAALARAANDPDLRPYYRPGTPPPSDGDLTRATLTHLATSRPDLASVIDQTVRLAQETTRFELATLAVGGLVLLVLQTEIKIDRNAAGEWRFRRPKKALRDSTLGRLLGQLLALYTNPPQK